MSSPNRKPLIIRGARQVGKSTLVRLFAEHSRRVLSEINLERFPELHSAFEKKDVSYLINVLEALPNMHTISPDGLLFLDELQAVPEAIPMLRYLREDRSDLPVIAAGSLIEFVLADHNFSMPVGRVEYLHMGPLTFTEFLAALEETKLLNLIHRFEFGEEIDVAVHQRLLDLMRVFFFVGGMPEAVAAYAVAKQLKSVTRVHTSILDTYREDFPKYVGSRSLARIQHVLRFSAANVGRKVKYSQYSTDDTSASIKGDIDLLCMARVLSKVTHSHCSNLPLQADMELGKYKLLFLDVGLMNAVVGLGWDVLVRTPDRQLINEGAIAEQFVGQHLQDFIAESPNRELTYWLREGKASNAEVDYVIAVNGQIVPIEVKAGASGSLKSLHQFAGEKGAKIAVRFDTGLPSIQSIATKIRHTTEETTVRYQMISLPIYLVERLPHIIGRIDDAKSEGGQS